MPQAVHASPLVRFGMFELDRESGELRKNGRKLKIDHQPLQALELLLERPGRVVTREELQEKLWPSDTFVDFEHSINSTIKRLRRTLDDSSETPRYIETLPRRGYRFICPVREDPATSTPSIRASMWRTAAVALFAAGTIALVTLSVSLRRADPQVAAIAVLPFDNLTGQPQDDYLVDGIHDDVITALAEVSALKVISRTSVMRYRKTPKPLREIAADLQVDGVLEGAVRRDGEGWHITAQLISARDDRHVWAQSYDRPFREVSTVPRAIARAVTTRLRIPLRPAEAARLATRDAVNPEVYKAIARGRHHSSKWSQEGWQKAIQYYQHAIDMDPTNAVAWSHLGSAYHASGGWGGRGDDDGEPNPELRRRAEAALRRAVELDPGNMNAHRSLGQMALAEWDWAGGAREFELAHRAVPQHAGFPIYLIAMGKFDEAVESQRRNSELSPLQYNSQLTLGLAAFVARRYDEAIASLKKTADLNPKLPMAHFELAWCYSMKGMHAAAVEQCEISARLARKTDPDTVVPQGCEWVYARAGRRAEALKLAQSIEATADDGHRYIRVAHVYDALGERERALEYLQKAYEQHASRLPKQWYDPKFSDEIKSDPRFQDIIRRTGQPWAKFPPPRPTGQSR